MAVPGCTDPSHVHGHSHSHQSGHDVGHGHSHAHATSAAEKYGIDTFVYSRRKPFHPKKLQDLIAFLPVKNAQVAVQSGGAEPWGSRVHATCPCLLQKSDCCRRHGAAAQSLHDRPSLVSKHQRQGASLRTLLVDPVHVHAVSR